MSANVSEQRRMSQFVDQLRGNGREGAAPAGKKRLPKGSPDMTSGEHLRTTFGRGAPDTFAGHIVKLTDLARRYVIQLLVDGVPLQLAIADQFDETLGREGVGDGCYGFSFIVPRASLCDATIVEARVANSDEPVGEVLCLADEREAVRPVPARRGVRWLGGVRFCGWLDGTGSDVPKVTALVDGLAVTEAYARAWQHAGGRAKEAKAVPAFDLHVPARFADGRVRVVRIVDEAGEDLPGSPLTFVAFDDGLQRTLTNLAPISSEALRGELFDRLVPAALPMSQYEEWQKRFPAAVPSPGKDLIAVVMAGDTDDAVTVQSLEAQTHANWVAAALPVTAENGAFDCVHLERFIKRQAADCDVVVFTTGGMELEPHALATFAEACRNYPGSRAIYSDFSVRGQSGERWPIFLSAFDYERMLEQGHGAQLFATRREQLVGALKARPASLFHLFQALADDPVSARQTVLHLPGSLGVLPDRATPAGSDMLAAATTAHLHARGVAADVGARPEGAFPRVRVARRVERPTVSIIIPTRNQVKLLRRCIETIAPAARRASAQIIVVDNDSTEPDTLKYLTSIDRRAADVLRVPGFFNFSRLNNLAAQKAVGEILLLLNDDVEALDDAWLEEMLGRIAEPDVGAVGATLLWPSGVVQHAGVVLGPSLAAAHAFTDRLHDDCGYGGMLTVARECSAVTAACLLTRKVDYLAVGGLDEVNFPVNFNDVDYCLKLRALGRRIVVSPYARLMHLESASRGSDQRPDRANRMQRELRALRARWLETIVNDPYYNPLLSLDPLPFSALAWPPRLAGPRLNLKPLAVAIPPGV